MVPRRSRYPGTVQLVGARSVSAVKLMVRRRPAIKGAPKDPWGRFRAGVAVLTVVLIAGTGGYMLLGLEPADAVYQTVITISTVGYREIGIVSGRYQIFTVFLILFGTGTSLYTLGVLLETLFEGRLDDQFRRRRMQRDIDHLDGHVVVCGYGQVGRAITSELRRAGEKVVVVDRSDELDEDILMVPGEATEDDTLLLAGLDRAATLVLALDSDVDNLYVALTARALQPELFIVARANQSTAGPKLRQAGADRVVNPHEIGGSRMAALVLQPDVAEFLDVVMHDEDLEVRLTEIVIDGTSTFTNRSLSACAIPESTGATVLAVRRGGAFITNPPSEFVIGNDDIVIALGTDEQLTALNARSRMS